jgi:hypothetical protein
VVIPRRPGSRADGGAKGTSDRPAASAAPQTDPTPPPPSSRHGAPAPSQRNGKIVRRAASDVDERERERQRLVERLCAAEGRIAISRAADDLTKAGVDFPADDQHVHLQLLEHSDERIVQRAIVQLGEVLTVEPPKRFTVLESRLRRLEEFADEAPTRDAAAQLRRRILSRT